jgi:hypothetical protein
MQRKTQELTKSQYAQIALIRMYAAKSISSDRTTLTHLA